ncbi:hypothetical protein AMJ82_09895, partial [candidate division TA06 bacterium SM23_40]
MTTRSDTDHEAREAGRWRLARQEFDMAAQYGEWSPVGRRHERSAGFTLIEVIVALVILAFLIMGTVVFFTSGLRTTNVTRNRQVATKLAQEVIESVKQGGYPGLNNIVGFTQTG